MARLSQPLIVLALAAFSAAALAACGESDAKLLPGETAREITANLDTVKQLADEGDCVGAESAAQQVSEQIGALGGVDEKLKRALREGATRLNEVVTECEETTEAIEPAVIPTEAEPADEGGDEDKEKKKPKDDEGGDEEAVDEEGDGDEPVEEPEGPATETPAPPLPPQAEGKGPEGEGTPSGGVSPGSAVGEGE